MKSTTILLIAGAVGAAYYIHRKRSTPVEATPATASDSVVDLGAKVLGGLGAVAGGIVGVVKGEEIGPTGPADGTKSLSLYQGIYGAAPGPTRFGPAPNTMNARLRKRAGIY